MPIVEKERLKNNHSCRIDVNCRELCEDLNQLGITPNKSLTLNVDMERIPKNLRHHFIRGYFDGDGSLNCYQRENATYLEWELSFISSEIFLNEILVELDKKRKFFSCGQNYRFCFKSKQDIYEVLSYLYADATIFLDRKHEKMQEFMALNDYQMAT